MARRALAAAPATLPLAAAVVMLAGWGIAGGAQAPTTWGWGAAALVCLLAAAVRAIPLRLDSVPPATRIAAAALAAYTLWSFASIAWADDGGAALEGASRTLLYLVVFVLFAAWRQRGASAAALLGAWTLALAVFAAYVVLRLPGSHAAQELFLGGNRLAEPTGYPNAAAALWLMPLWPALALASARDVPWGLRGVFAAAAVLFAGLGLLTGSRGAFIAVPVVLALTFLLAPGRVRRMVLLVPVGACFAASVPAILRVEDHPDGPPVDVLTSAGRALLLAAVAAGAIVTIGAFLEERRPVRAEAEARAHRVLGALGLAAILAALVAGGAWLGDPATRVDDAWASFKQGYAENSAGNRLTAGLGSNRYDFYRVALDVFAEHPIAGAGADNFQQEYLARGRSEETPRYPHSVELRALSETGVIGAALLLTALVAGVAAGLRGTRARDPLARAAAVGALGAFAYWLVHGSADWFFEIAGLGAPAFAWLGLAAALAPRPEEEHDPPRWPLLYGRARRGRAARAVARAPGPGAGRAGVAHRPGRRLRATGPRPRAGPAV
jgi:hypothetical protein